MLHEHITFHAVTETDLETVLSIYKSNQAYFEQASNTVPTRQTVLDDIAARPPHVPLHDKHYELVYVDAQPVAVIDVLTNFPADKIAHIGLLMVDGDLHAKGYGRQILIALEHRLHAFHTLRIGVFEQNEQALHFWQRNGFHIVDSKEMTILEKQHIVWLLEKPLPLTPMIATTAHIEELANFFATCNKKTTMHIGYVGTNPAEIAETLRDDFVQQHDELSVAIMTNDAGQMIGAIGLDVEDDHAEVWGPFSEQRDVSQALWQLLQAKLPHVHTYQFFIHAQNVQQQTFVQQLGARCTGTHRILSLCRTDFQQVTGQLEPFHMRYVDAFTKLHNDTFPATYYDAQAIMSRLSNNNQLWLLLEQQTLIGYSYFEVVPAFEDASLHYIAIDPRYHKQGYGTKLLTETLSHMFAFPEIDHLTLSVSSNNDRANRVYEKVGFVTESELVSYTFTIH